MACDGTRVLWVRRFGDASSEAGLAIEPDGEGGVFVAGHFAGTLDLDGQKLVTGGGVDMFLARFDGDGNHLFSRSFGDSQAQNGTLNLTRTPDGGVLLGGQFFGAVDFGDGDRFATGTGDGFVARYDASLEHVWTFTTSGTGSKQINRAGIDAATGYVAASGRFTEQINLGETMHEAQPGFADAFVVQLSADGAHLWSKSWGGEMNDNANGLIVDALGRIFVAGSIGGKPGAAPVTVGTEEVIVTDAHNDAYVVAYQPGGNPTWTQTWPAPLTQDMRRAALEPASGNILIGGRTDSTVPVDFGGGPKAGKSGMNLFIAKLEPNAGGHVASAVFSDLNANPFGFAADATGNVFVASRFVNTLELGDDVMVSAGDHNGVVVKLDPTLAPLWAFHFGAEEDDGAAAVALDARGRAFVLGAFQKQVTLPGCAPVDSAGSANLLLMKLTP